MCWFQISITNPPDFRIRQLCASLFWYLERALRDTVSIEITLLSSDSKTDSLGPPLFFLRRNYVGKNINQYLMNSFRSFYFTRCSTRHRRLFVNYTYSFHYYNPDWTPPQAIYRHLCCQNKPVRHRHDNIHTSGIRTGDKISIYVMLNNTFPAIIVVILII